MSHSKGGRLILNRQRALIIKNSLSAGSKRNLLDYCKRLRADYDKVIFDDQVLGVMNQYAKKPIQVEQVRQWCNQTNYNQSTKQYSQIVLQLERFAQADYTSFRWNQNYQEAKAILSNYFSKASLMPLCYSSDQDIVDALPKKTTHSGWTYVETGRKRKGDNLEDIYKRFSDEVSQAIENGTFNKPILIGVRTQCGNVYNDEGERIFDDVGKPAQAKHKTRMVSMIDLNIIIAELIWAKPLQEFLGIHTAWYAGGKNDKLIEAMIVDYRSKHKYWLSLDYSKYDQSISSWLIRDAFEIISHAFVKLQYPQLWNVIIDDFIHKTFIDGEGKIWESHKGVPSGSMFTQIIDSVVNMLMILTFMISKGKTFSDFKSLIMGDDNLIFADGVKKVEICTYLQKNFGIEANVTKTVDGDSRDESPEFLSRQWRIEGPYRHPNILICKLLFPERFRDYSLQGVTPEMIFYSYCLAYRRGMIEAFDVDRFFKEHPTLRSEVGVKGSEYLPGYLGYAYQYGLIK